MFGKRAQSTLTPTPESGVGASEHVSTSAGDKMSLDDVIAKMKAVGNEDARGEEILAAAITLRDCGGRDRKEALRKMANAWGVSVTEKVQGKYKRRPNSALAEDIQASVCKAALDWESQAEPSQSSDRRAPSIADAESVLKKARTTGAAEHGAAESSASRRGGGEHGEADAPERGGGTQLHGAHPKRQRTLRQMFVSSGSGHVEGVHGQAGASEHGGGERLESGAAEHCDGIEVDEHAATTCTEVFVVHDREEDRVLLDWLRERPEHPRCSVLLQQIMEWTGKCNRAEMRALATAQGIVIRRQDQADAQNFREAVRRHFKAAVGQVKGSLACFQLSATRGASEHLDSVGQESEHVLNAAEVVDLRTLLLLLKQRKADMPHHLQQAIRRLGGGTKRAKKMFEILLGCWA